MCVFGRFCLESAITSLCVSLEGFVWNQLTSLCVSLEGFVWNQPVFHFTAMSLLGKRGGQCLGSLHRTLMCRSEWLEGQCAGQPVTHSSACFTWSAVLWTVTMVKTAQPFQVSPKLLL